MNDDTSSKRARISRSGTARPPIRLQARDREILREVWESRFLTRTLLNQLFPPASGLTDTDHIALARRLQALYARGYLDRFKGHDSRELAYGLGARGARELVAEGHPVQQTDWQEKNRRVVELFVDHALMVARFRVALVLAARAIPGRFELGAFSREKQALRATWRRRGEPVSVSPDAFAILHDRSLPEGKQRFPYLVEADRSTMTLGRLVSKCQRYVWLYDDDIGPQVYGVPIFTVLLLCKSAARASNLLDCLSAPDSLLPPVHRRFFLVTSEESYMAEPTNVLARIWRAADDPDEVRAIVSSPIARRS